MIGPERRQGDLAAPGSRRGGLGIAAAGVLAALVALAGGCAGPAMLAAQPSDASLPNVPTLLSLQEKARRQALNPERPAADLPPVPGLPAEIGVVLTPESHPEAFRSLEETLAEVAAAEAAEAPRPSVASESDRRRALVLYVQGRQKLLAGEVEGALADLQEATRLDPGSPEPWRELAEAHLARGSAAEAKAAFERALGLGLESPRVLEQLGRYALERGDAEGAIALFARALRADPRRADEALPNVLYVQLARALAGTGRVAAAVEAMSDGLSLPERSTAATRYHADLAAIRRRQGDLWRDLGDWNARIGRYAAALEAYQRALEGPSLENEPVAPRQVHAALRAGRPAEAAACSLLPVMSAGGRVDEAQLDLLRYVAAQTGLGRDLARALAELHGSLPSPVSPSLSSRLVRARAALLSPREAERSLRAHLAGSPADSAAIADLLALAADEAGAARTGASLVAEEPFVAATVAEAILRSRFDPERVLGTLRKAGDDGSLLLAAHLHGQRGEGSLAMAALEGIDKAGRFGSASRVAAAELALTTGKGEAPAFDAAAPGLTRAERAARVRLLALAERYAEAMEAVRPLVAEGSPADVGDLLLAARVARRTGETEQAEAWLRRATEADRFDERPYALLLEIHGSDPATADQHELARVLRDLRQIAPNGRVMRMLRSQELAQRDPEQAEAALLELASEDPSDFGVLDLLATSLERQARAGDEGAVERGVRWAREALSRRPHSPTLLAFLARLEVAAGRAAAAEAMLRERLSQEWHPQTAFALELVVRDALRRPGEADALALDRLDRLSATPTRSLERAEILARLDRAGEAVWSVLDALNGDIPSDQAGRAIPLVSRLAGAASARGGEPLREPVLRLLDRLAARGVTLPPELHERRLVLLAGGSPPDERALLAAASLAREQHPSLRSAPYLRAAELLAEAGREGAALVLVERAAGAAPTLDTEMLMVWFGLATQAGDTAAVKRAIEAAWSAGRLRAVLERLGSEGVEEGRELRAEAAYVIALYTAQLGRETESLALYELALAYDPRHPWACNNLGYHLVESGGDLDKAERLLQTAYEVLPGNASVIDSLAWLRYKRGILRNRVGADGGVIREGAVELLRRAAATERGQRNPTILDHLGDALWADGQKEEAVQQWQAAEQQAALQIAIAGGSPAARELRAVMESARAKQRAAVAGEEVPISPRVAAAGGGEGGNPSEGSN